MLHDNTLHDVSHACLTGYTHLRFADYHRRLFGYKRILFHVRILVHLNIGRNECTRISATKCV